MVPSDTRIEAPVVSAGKGMNPPIEGLPKVFCIQRQFDAMHEKVTGMTLTVRVPQEFIVKQTLNEVNVETLLTHLQKILGDDCAVTNVTAMAGTMLPVCDIVLGPKSLQTYQQACNKTAAISA